jgi:hypothetical protein
MSGREEDACDIAPSANVKEDYWHPPEYALVHMSQADVPMRDDPLCSPGTWEACTPLAIELSEKEVKKRWVLSVLSEEGDLYFTDSFKEFDDLEIVKKMYIEMGQVAVTNSDGTSLPVKILGVYCAVTDRDDFEEVSLKNFKKKSEEYKKEIQKCKNESNIIDAGNNCKKSSGFN